MKNTNKTSIKKLTKRGQAIANRKKERCTVKPYTKRLFIRKVGNEPVGVEMVDIAELFPTKTTFRIHRL